MLHIGETTSEPPAPPAADADSLMATGLTAGLGPTPAEARAAPSTLRAIPPRRVGLLGCLLSALGSWMLAAHWLHSGGVASQMISLWPVAARRRPSGLKATR